MARSRESRRLPPFLGHIVALVLMPLTLACGSQPIPQIVVAGTTLTIALPADFPGLDQQQSFGRAYDPNSPPAYDSTSALEDPQRGEFVFSLHDPADPETEIHCPLRYIVNLVPNPNSAATKPGAPERYALGQTIAFVDIPLSAVPVGTDERNLELRIRRVRRSEVSPYDFVDEPITLNGADWWGWSVLDPPGASQSGNEIRILRSPDNEEHFTQTHGWIEAPGGVGGGDVADDLPLFVPYPHFEVLVPASGVGGATPPGAWEAELTYPARRVKIQGVTAKRSDPNGAMVMWSEDSPPSEPVGCSAPDGTIKIQVIDPDRETTGVRVSYELRNFDSTCGGRAKLMDFNILSFGAYDLDGEAYPISHEILPESFL